MVVTYPHDVNTEQITIVLPYATIHCDHMALIKNVDWDIPNTQRGHNSVFKLINQTIVKEDFRLSLEDPMTSDSSLSCDVMRCDQSVFLPN